MAPIRDVTKSFKYWAVSIFVIKLIIIFNIQGGVTEILEKPFLIQGIWLGADGENYLKGFSSLRNEGIFSTNAILNYWPAGYPLLILLLSTLSEAWTLPLLAIFQSAIFSWAVLLFASQLLKTNIKKFTYVIFIFILFNPTLSLSSLTIGYESLTASGFLISAAIIVKDLVEKNESKFISYLLINSTIFGILAFLQPRLIVSGILINLFWVLLRRRIKLSLILICFSLLITLFFPATLMYRNNQATGVNTISTNLGNALNIGAGDNANGGYMREGFGVPCNLVGSVVERDNQLTRCVFKWYVDNPSKALKLFYNKTIYFWSPWFNNGFAGNVFTGTMARNPWLKINPLTSITANPEGSNLIFGFFGKLTSWLWLIGGLALLGFGFVALWREKSIDRLIGTIAMIAIVTNWLISLLTIGDHRFRIPIMGMSIFLQAIGLQKLFKKKKV